MIIFRKTGFSKKNEIILLHTFSIHIIMSKYEIQLENKKHRVCKKLLI
jgi:hypothetical protein